MTPAHLDGNMLTHYLINFGDSALSFIPPPQLPSPSKSKVLGGLRQIHNVAGPTCATQQP